MTWVATKPERSPSHDPGDSLIERLHSVQLLHGYLPRQELQQLAISMARPLSQVMGVASFYHLFRLDPPRPTTTGAERHPERSAAWRRTKCPKVPLNSCRT